MMKLVNIHEVTTAKFNLGFLGAISCEMQWEVHFQQNISIIVCLSRIW